MVIYTSSEEIEEIKDLCNEILSLCSKKKAFNNIVKIVPCDDFIVKNHFDKTLIKVLNKENIPILVHEFDLDNNEITNVFINKTRGYCKYIEDLLERTRDTTDAYYESGY